MQKRLNVLEGNETSVILRLVLPMIYGFLSVIGVSLVDAYFLGKLGTTALAAFGFIFPLILFFNGIVLGIANGASALSSRAYGAKDMYRVRRITTDAIILGVGITIVMSIIGYIVIDPLFYALGARGDTMVLIREYLEIWFLGSAFVVFPMIGNNAMTAIGNTRGSANIMLLVLIFNTIFDPIFIFGFGPIPAFGFKGAAIAVVVSRILNFFVAFYILLKKDKIIALKKPKFSEVLQSWREILYIGLPNALTNLIMPLGFSVITHIAAKFGKEAVAALAVAERIEALGITITMSFAVSMSPFVGQNFGANKFGRIKTGIRKAQQLSMYWGLILFFILFFFSKYIVTFFNTDPQVIEYFVDYFHFLSFSYPFLGYIFITGVTLTVFKKPYQSALLSLTRVFIVYIPLSYILTNIFQVRGIFIASMLANFITAGLGLYLIRKYRKIMLVEGMNQN